jgi:hypothetical protein
MLCFKKEGRSKKLSLCYSCRARATTGSFPREASCSDKREKQGGKKLWPRCCLLDRASRLVPQLHSFSPTLPTSVAKDRSATMQTRKRGGDGAARCRGRRLTSRLAGDDGG